MTKDQEIAALKKALTKVLADRDYLEAELAKARGVQRPVRKGAGNAWDESSQGLFRESKSTQVGPPRYEGDGRTERREIGGVKKEAPRGRGITDYAGDTVKLKEPRPRVAKAKHQPLFQPGRKTRGT